MLCKTGIIASPLYKYLKYEELKMYWGEGALSVNSMIMSPVTIGSLCKIAGQTFMLLHLPERNGFPDFNAY